jgi:integrase/recombinase XerD
VLLLLRYLQDVRPRLLKGGQSKYLLIGQRGAPMPAEDITKHVKRELPGSVCAQDRELPDNTPSVIANLLKQGKDLRLVQASAGHRYPSSTENYRQGMFRLCRKRSTNITRYGNHIV